MRKFIFFILFAVLSATTYAQYTTIANESFTTTPSGWLISPSNSWTLNGNLSVSSPNSMLGFIPNSNGDSVELISPWYDLRTYAYVFLQFSHICKVTSSDVCQIKYQELSMPGWKTIPTSSYLGKQPSAYAGAKFSQSSYSTWAPGDSLAIPTNSWWKEESYNVSGEVSYAQVRFKFIIKKGNVMGSQFAYGWLIDNFKLLASMNEIKPPVVEFISTSPVDTVYNTGPYTVTAKIATRTYSPIAKPIKLNVSYTYNNITTYDTLTMTMVTGDSIFSAVIPQKFFGTKITYNVKGMDSIGNDAYAFSEFYVKRLKINVPSGYVTIGTLGTTVSPNILYYAYDYTWTKQLYLGREINASKNGGVISNIAFRPSSTWIISNQYCYFKAVDDSIIANPNYTDPSLDGYTLVWSGNYTMTANTWSDIPLNTPFVLPPNKNLMVFWANYDGSSGNNTSTSWYATYTNPYYRAVYKYQSGSFPASTGTLYYYRPDVRFYIQGTSDDSNSVALLEIKNPTDSVVAASAHQVPVVVTIKNKGFSYLDSCDINWTLNGILQPTYKWKGHLYDDFNATDTIGHYLPSVNLYDTLIVWANSPNGVYDSTSYDDTLMRVAFGVPDLAMGFTTDQGDTVYNTGPFEVIAQIYSRTGATLPSPLKLNVRYTNGMVNTFDTLILSSLGTDLYKTIIPQHVFGTGVHYSISMVDILGNYVSIADSFYIKRISGGGTSGTVYIGDTTLASGNLGIFFHINANASWSRNLYYASELNATSNSVLISKFAVWNGTYNFNVTRANQKLFLKAVDSTFLTYNNYIDPATVGATLVWSGGITTQLYWNEITLTTPFILPPGKNLLVYFVDDYGSTSGNTIYWVYNTTPANTIAYGYGTSLSSTSTNVLATRLTVRFTFGGGSSDDSNSVALKSINNPTSSVIAGQTTPVITTIKNKGIANLTSCKINWSLNGVLQAPKNWTGNLPDDFDHTDTIGYYIPRNSMFDTLCIWVSDPNGAYDSTHYDDTLQIITFGCGQIFSGTYIVGPDTAHSDFETIGSLLSAINLCGTSGSITVKMQSGTYAENIKIPDLSKVMGTDTLFITSLAGDADSVIFKPATGVAMTLNGVNNVYVNNITLDATTGTYGMQFLSTCTNVEVYKCKIISDPYTTSSSYAGVYYGNTSGSGKYLINVRFKKNTISGGYYNMYFYYSGSGTTTMGLSSITIDSNILKDANTYGIYSYYYGNYPSISYNTISSRNNSTSSYYAMYTYEYHNINKIVSNKIRIIGTSTCYGMCLQYDHNVSTYGAPGPGLLSNNEVITIGSGSTCYGIYTYSASNWNIFNNTVYVKGTSTCYGIYRYNTSNVYQVNIRYNITSTYTSGTGYPLYISSATYATSQYGSLNYNNYYSNGSYIAYVGNTVSTIAALKLTTTQDTNSISIQPSFIDSSSNLDLVDYTGFDCPQDGNVLTNINGSPRLTTTTMGAYSLLLLNLNARMKEVTGWEKQAMAGRNFPVTAIIENNGLQNLTSATINWSFNNVIQTPVSWTGNLALGQSASVYLGNVLIKTGDSNDLVTWISNPNASTDMYPANDTLKLSSIGGPGVIVEFIAPYVTDTITGNIGPFVINARVKRLSQQPLTTPVLNVYTLWQGTPGTANITMTAVSGDSLWKATIPQQAYGSYIQYSITAYDSLGAMASDTGWFYVKRIGSSGNVLDSVIIGTGTGTSYFCPTGGGYYYSYTQQIYTRTQIGKSGMIGKIAFQCSTVPSMNQSITVYLGHTSQVDFPSTSNYIVLANLTQVYLGSFYPTNTGWAEIPLTTAFMYNGTDNLVIAVDNNTGNSAGSYFYNTTTTNSQGWRAMTSTTSTVNVDPANPSGTASSLSVSTLLPNLKIFFKGMIDDSNSVELKSILSPKDTAQCFQTLPIQIIIKNKGMKTLTSCNIEWKRNGVQQPTYYWTGNLPEDFVDTVVIANYTPSFGIKDTFKIWVSQPNGQLDSINYDDTLTKVSFGYYTGGFISSKAIIAPVNGANDVCFGEKSALKVKLNNSGTRMVNLVSYPLTFYYKITGAVTIQGTKLFNTGFFWKADKEFVLDTINILTPGTYNIEVYFYCGDDVYNGDDTLRGAYQVNTILLPYDNNFSLSGSEYNITNSGATGWYVDTDAVMTPVYGTGLMRMEPETGAISTITFNSMNFTGTSFPTMEFWFAHDNTNPSSQDRIYVKLSTDGGATYSILQTIYRYKASATTPTWTNYLFDLSTYSNQKCLIVAIEGISAGGSDLYIDRLKINSNPEIAVKDIDIQNVSNLTACDLNKNTLSVTLKNNTIQSLDFSETPVDITLVISNAINQTITRSITTGILAPYGVDTYVIDTNISFSATGTFDFKAYINSIDKNALNDTLLTSLSVLPDVSIDSIVNTGCEVVGTSTYKTIFIKNEGNINVTNIPIRIKVDGADIVNETAAITLLPGEKKSYTMLTPYIVPMKSNFVLSVSTELSCDVNSSNNKDTMSHCVIEPMAKVTAVIDPITTPCDYALSKKYATVIVNNLSSSPLTNQIVCLEIDDHNGNKVIYKDTIVYLNTGSTNYRFDKMYTVPNLNEGATYKITSYVYDPVYGSSLEACVTKVGISETESNNWMLGQNIPNPAQSIVTIPYTLPTNGEVVFKLMTVTGQLLFENTMQAHSGDNIFDLNIKNLSSGIYFYSMEYNGNKMVKKMTIQK